MAEEMGGTFGWGMFNCIFTAGLLREAAAQAYGLIGEIIPSDLPDTVGWLHASRSALSSELRRGTHH